MNDLTARAKEAEAYETPRWAVEAILEVELLTRQIVDPCAGRCVMSDVAGACGYTVFSFDKYNWPGFRGNLTDFLTNDNPFLPQTVNNSTVLMNPPFSLAEQFVERCFELNARKIACFKRFAWWESKGRREFWEKHPPNRIYVCGDRATCWRYDIPEDQRKSGSTTAHAWYVWERGHPPGPVLSHIYKGD